MHGLHPQHLTINLALAFALLQSMLLSPPWMLMSVDYFGNKLTAINREQHFIINDLESHFWCHNTQVVLRIGALLKDLIKQHGKDGTIHLPWLMALCRRNDRCKPYPAGMANQPLWLQRYSHCSVFTVADIKDLLVTGLGWDATWWFWDRMK